jgi:tripartite-type tricarboxylate transporter receptor subunit TctC
MLAAAPAQASDWPTRAVTVVVPYAPGGFTDTLARLASKQLSDKFHQPFVVENRLGAGGAIAAAYVANAAPDGYTLLFGSASQFGVSPVIQKVGYEPESFAPIAVFGTIPFLLGIKSSLPAKTVPEFVAYAKANPGKLNYGSSGSGSVPHLAAELFKSMAKVDMVHVPFKGSAESMNATVGGQIDLTFFAFSSALANAKAGKLRAIGVGGTKRNSALPDVPSTSEALPGYLAASWTAMVATPGTPPEIVQKLQQAMAEIKAMPDVQERMVKQGDQVFEATPAQMADFLKQERQLWGDVIKAAGIKAE